MSIFNETTRPITVHAWTVDFSKFESNPEATTENNLPEYLLPEEIVNEFSDMGYDIFLEKGRSTGISRIIIRGTEPHNSALDFVAGDGSTVIVHGDYVDNVEPKGH